MWITSARHHQHWIDGRPLSLVFQNLWLQAENDNLSMRWLFVHGTTWSFSLDKDEAVGTAMSTMCVTAWMCSCFMETEELIWCLKFKQTQPEISTKMDELPHILSRHRTDQTTSNDKVYSFPPSMSWVIINVYVNVYGHFVQMAPDAMSC